MFIEILAMKGVSAVLEAVELEFRRKCVFGQRTQWEKLMRLIREEPTVRLIILDELGISDDRLDAFGHDSMLRALMIDLVGGV